MKIYSYIIRNDLGFSPNPFWGVCTLACCKPIIRRTAEEDDWVVGMRGKGLYKKLRLPPTTNPLEEYGIVYAMKVTEKLSFDEYYERFPEKDQTLIKLKPFTGVAIIFINQWEMGNMSN